MNEQNKHKYSHKISIQSNEYKAIGLVLEDEDKNRGITLKFDLFSEIDGKNFNYRGTLKYYNNGIPHTRDKSWDFVSGSSQFSFTDEDIEVQPYKK
jgi:hypothetical protein